MPRCSCGKTSNFNMPGETKGICCSKCKTDEMVDVKNKKCSCGKQPSYNVPGETRGICCSKCKTDEMVDVKNKKCPCGNQPSYNFPGQMKRVCCKDCKTDGMIDVMSKRCPCGSLSPKFNMPDKIIGVRCAKCKTDGMIDVANKMCPGYNGKPCPVRTQLTYGYEYCMTCDPNEGRRKWTKLYENAFFEYITGKMNYIRNETVHFDPNETSRRCAFLDGIVLGDGIIVCLEVDENKHRGSYYACDEARMHLATAELLQRYPGNNISWVRVNPSVGSKNEWSPSSIKKREKRFDEVIKSVNDILETRDTRIVYIGFK